MQKEEYKTLEYNLTTTGLELDTVTAFWDEVIDKYIFVQFDSFQYLMQWSCVLFPRAMVLIALIAA